MTGALEAIQDDIAERRPDLLEKLVGYQAGRDALIWIDAFPGAIHAMKVNFVNGLITTAQGRFAGRHCLFQFPLSGCAPIAPARTKAKSKPPRIADREYTKAAIAGRAR